MNESPILGSNSKFEHVDIVGAGIAGLVLGYQLQLANIPFTLYEKTDHIGGKIKTTQLEYGIAESAANAIFANQPVIDLLKQLKLDWIKARPKLKRLIWTSQGALKSPMSFKIILKMFFGLFKKIPSNHKLQEMSVADFFTPWLGQEFVDEVISTGLQGIYADRAENILLSAMWPHFTKGSRYIQFIAHIFRTRRGNKSYGSISFKGGMGEFTHRLKLELSHHIQSSHEVKKINPQNLTILCTDAHDAALILQQDYPKLSLALNEIEYKGVTTTTIFLKNKIECLLGAFGVLFSPRAKEQFKTYGVLNNSEIFSDRAKPEYNSYTIICPPQADFNDIKNDILKIGNGPMIESYQTTQWTRAIPRYNLGLKNQLANIRTNLPANVGLFASYTNGVSLRHMINFAPIFADAIKHSYQAGQ